MSYTTACFTVPRHNRSYGLNCNNIGIHLHCNYYSLILDTFSFILRKFKNNYKQNSREKINNKKKEYLFIWSEENTFLLLYKIFDGVFYFA